MKAISLVLILACSAFGQAKSLMSGTTSRDGIQVEYSTRIEPPSNSEEFNLGGGTASSRDNWHRFLYHPKERKYFGYDISIQRLAGEQYNVTLLPLSADPEKLRLKPSTGWILLPLPKAPGTQTVRGGETIALDLLVNPSTGQKIVDYLTIQGEERNVEVSSSPARDFTVEDASLSLRQPRVTVNGQLVPDTANTPGAAIGPVLFFHLPKRGRFALSLAPHEAYGFHRAGEVSGSNLTIAWGSDKYVLNCNGRIAPGPKAYHVYVRHDPDIEFGRGFVIGATSPAMLLRR